MKQDAHVLVGFAEGLPTAEVIFSLLDAGHKVSVFTRVNTRLPLFKHLPLEQVYFIVAPEESIEMAQNDLAEIFEGPDAPDTVLALDDPALWLVNATFSESEAGANFANVMGARVDVALDKSIQIEHAKAAGLALPPTTVIRTPQDLGHVTSFPSIAKPAYAIEVENGKIARGNAGYFASQADIASFQTSLPDQMQPLLVQPLIAGVGEGVFGFATETGVMNWSGHRRVRMMNPHGSGSSACISHPPSEEMKMICMDFLRRSDWRGPFMIELLRASDGTAYFMELNGRMWGSMALARRSGLEYPAWAVANALDPACPPPEVIPPENPVTVRHLGRDLVHLLFTLRGPKTEFHKADWPKFWHSLPGALKPGRGKGFYNYDPAHPHFFLADAWHVLRNKLKGGS